MEIDKKGIKFQMREVDGTEVGCHFLISDLYACNSSQETYV